MTTASLIHILILLLIIGAVVYFLRFAAFAPWRGGDPAPAMPALWWPGGLSTIIAIIFIIWLLQHVRL